MRKVKLLSAKQRQFHVFPHAKLLDIRDASDFMKSSVPTSINIPVGRLAFVWEKELTTEDYVVILSDTSFKGRKAARILFKKGFRHLYLMVDTVSAQCEWFRIQV
ncbi:hypothetical protein P364_0132115 [Paenibacillus sp. MAEPY2]|uniref:rhodanese-like domain-containing protein n=2 Tax=Paenibacillus TaxID=44249 RepID=UPI00052C348B|nr:rhodanese-like domain-containing protein [Paenibacillus taichungensis]KGP77726.1 hypothetical protein P364_0132115 [Paenibacillus sp. MAEPY2]KGP77979.1 hypothetical protein P363_0132735 [Paenibacillus sp. MAEPY1]